jgi:hypothetical protein
MMITMMQEKKPESPDEGVKFLAPDSEYYEDDEQPIEVSEMRPRMDAPKAGTASAMPEL